MNEPDADLQSPEAARTASDLAVALAEARKRNECAQAEHWEALLQIARLNARLGHREQALVALWHVVDAGFWDVEKLQTDAAFVPYRSEEPFRAIVRACWAKGYLGMLEREEREEFQCQAEILRVLAFRPGEQVADLGAGSGYFAFPIARAVLPDGIVWAADAVQEMLDYLGRRIVIEGVTNIRLVKTVRDDPRLPEGDLDTLFLSDMLHYVPDRVPFLRALSEHLRPGGRMIVLDFTPKSMEDRPWGPSPEQQFSAETIQAEMRAAGLRPTEAYDFLPEQHLTVHVRE